MTGQPSSRLNRTVMAVGEGSHARDGRPAAFSRLLIELMGEQMRHNLEVAAALGRTVDPGEAVRVRGEPVSASLERWSQFSSSCLAIVRAAAPADAQPPLRKAA